MQLEQSGFRIYRAVLSFVPSPCLLIAALTCLALLGLNTLLVSDSNLDRSLGKCWQQYYDQMHPDIVGHIRQIIVQNNGSLGSRQISQAYNLVNSTTVIRLQMDSQMPEGADCIIKINGGFSPENKDQQQDPAVLPEQQGSKNNPNQVIGYLAATPALFAFNLSKPELRTEHGVTYNVIVIPKIAPKYNYIGSDYQASRAEEIVWETKEAFDSMKQVKLNWLLALKQLADQPWEALIKDANEPDAAGDQDKGKEADPNPNPQQENKQKTISPMNAILSNLLEKAQSLEAKIKYSLFLLESHVTENNFYGKHSMLYRLSDKLKWSSLEFPQEEAILGKPGMFGKTFLVLFIWCELYFLSMVCGMFVKYCYISVLTFLSLVGGERVSRKIGWLHRYMRMVQRSHLAGSRLKLKVQLVLAILGMQLLFVAGFYLLIFVSEMVLKDYYLPSNSAYSSYFINTILLTEIAHYIFLRSRTSLRFYWIFHICSSILTLTFIHSYKFYQTAYFLNLHRLLNCFVILAFLLIEKLILQDEFYSEFKPTLNKPRMLFYLGYDMDWHRSAPPIWTTFVTWHDLTFCSLKEKAYLDQDYELLYGLLLGMNEPQQLPQNQAEEEELGALRADSMSENYA